MTNKNNTKNFIWNALGLTFNAFNSLFFLIIVELINGLDIAGVFTYAFSLCCLFYVFAIFYNRPFQVSDAKDRFSFSQYFTCRLILSIISLVAILIFSIISQFDGFKILVIMLIMVFRVIEAISDCIYGFIQKQGELYKTGISLTIKAVVGVIVFLILDLLTHDILVSICSLIFVNLIVLLFYDLPIFRKLNRESVKIIHKSLSKLLKTCFPVFIFSFLMIFLANCQKYVLTYFEPNDIQTIFGILIMPATVVSLIGSYLINPFINKLTSHKECYNYQKFKTTTLKIISYLILFGIFCSIACYFIGIPILNFIFQLNLDAYRIDLLIVIISAILYAIVMVISNFLTILNKNSEQAIICLLTSVLAVIISVIAICNHGLSGAINAFLIVGVIFLFAYLVLFYKKLISFRKDCHENN